MAITYKYPSGTLTLQDYLLGTDISTENVTRSFKVIDIVSAILAAKSIGTVASVATSDSTYIAITSSTGGPITTTGTLTPSLSATGAPSALTYLRGDGTWSEPGPTPTDIGSLYNGSSLTTDTSSWKFTGDGVTATDSNNFVTVDIPGALSKVENVINSTYITATGTVSTNPSQGNVTINNAGVYQVRAGGNVTLSGLTQDVTVSTTKNPGTIVVVNEGYGTEIVNGTTNPELQIDLTGSDNYIRTQVQESEEGGQDVFGTINENDLIGYNQLTTSNVKTTRLGNLSQDMLSAIKTYIDNADKNKIKNDTDTNTSTAKAMQIVSLTISEYNSIPTKDPNTVYCILGAGTAYLVSLNVTVNITDTSTGGPASPSNYTVSTTINGTPGTSITGINGTAYSFVTTVTLNNSYTFATPASYTPSQTISGTISGAATLTQTVTASISPPVQTTYTATLQLNNTIGGTGSYTISGDTHGATQQVVAGQTVNWNTVAVAGPNSAWAQGSPTYDGVTSPTGFQDANMPAAPTSFPHTLAGTINSTAQTYTAAWNPVISASNFTGDTAYATSTYINVSPNGASQGGLYPNDSATFSAPAVTANNSTIAPNSVTLSSLSWKDSGGNALFTPNLTVTIPGGGGNTTTDAYLHGNITYNVVPVPVTMTMDWDTSGVTNASGATLTLAPIQGHSVTGSSGSAYNLGPPSSPTVSLPTEYYWSAGGTPTNTNAYGIIGTYPPTNSNSSWSVTGTVLLKTVTVSVSWNLTFGVTYSIDFYHGGGGSPTQFASLTGSGSQSATVGVQPGSSISWSVTRNGSSWCSNTPLPLCPAGSQGCLPGQYGCATNIPQYSGSIVTTLNGGTISGGVFDRTFTPGSTVIQSSPGNVSSLNQGDTILTTINE